jgi:spore germination protein YaaH
MFKNFLKTVDKKKVTKIGSIVLGFILSFILVVGIYGLVTGKKDTVKIPEIKTSINSVDSLGTQTKKTSLSDSSTRLMAWVYPGSPACSAKNEYQDGRRIDVLKPEYLKLDPNGEIVTLTDKDYDCNGYSKENAELIKKNSKEAIFMVSGRMDGLTPLFKSKEKMDKSIDAIMAILDESGFDGVEIDFEDYGSWTDTQYIKYKEYIKQLGDRVHEKNKKLSVDVPAIINDRYQSFYKLKYEDFNDLPVDYLTLMAYDFQYDNGVGAPVASFDDIVNTIKWAKSKYKKTENIVVGINNYGYYGKSGDYKMTLVTTKAIKDKYKDIPTRRDPNSGEIFGKRGNEEFVFSDTESMDKKREVVEKEGINKISVWHLGGNSWFSR